LSFILGELSIFPELIGEGIGGAGRTGGAGGRSGLAWFVVLAFGVVCGVIPGRLILVFVVGFSFVGFVLVIGLVVGLAFTTSGFLPESFPVSGVD
jgi:hypothetical protein